MNQIKEQGFTFDVGPTIVMMPDIYREIFVNTPEENPQDYIPMKRAGPNVCSSLFQTCEQQRVSSELTELDRPMLESISPVGYSRLF